MPEKKRKKRETTGESKTLDKGLSSCVDLAFHMRKRGFYNVRGRLTNVDA